MNHRQKINELIEKHSILQIEQSFFYYFISKTNLDYRKSATLVSYFSNFKESRQILDTITELNISDITDLVNYLELLIPKEDKKLNGAFFTPSYIVDYIIYELRPGENDKILDPSCGCGAFLLGLTKYYRKNYNKCYKDIFKENVFGIDILDYNTNRTIILLTILALLEGAVVDKKDFNILCSDSLRLKANNVFPRNPKGKFNFIVGNPPYVKFQDLTNEMRAFLSTGWYSINQGTFNLFYAFFELGYNLLTSNGRLGYITPNNYFTSLAGQSLREFFKNKKCLYKIVDFNHKKVFDAQTYTAISFLGKEEAHNILYDRIGESLNPPSFLQNLAFSSISLDSQMSQKWRLLKSEEQNNIKTIETVGSPLNKLFDIRVGIATLKDDLYFVDTENTKSNYYLKNLNGVEYKIEKSIVRPIIKISDFTNQLDLQKNTRSIIFPYTITAGGAVVYTEDYIEKHFPYCFLYFEAIRDKLESRDKGRGNIDPFYAYGRSQGLARFGTKLLTPTFSKKPRFFISRNKNSLFCNGYGIFFKQSLEKSGDLFNEDFPFNSEENIEIIQKILNSIVMHYYISKTSVSIEGGFPCYQKNFIEKFTIPEFTQKELELLRSTQKPDIIDRFLIKKYNLTI